jgi:hypothetical protein
VVEQLEEVVVDVDGRGGRALELEQLEDLV